MIEKRHVAVVNHLRKDARQSLISLARNLDCAQSTVYDHARHAEKYIRKNTVLLDFEKLGLVHQYLMISVENGRDELRIFLESSPNLNTIYRTTNMGFLMEAVFANLSESENFIDCLKANFNIQKIERYMVVGEIAKEMFLTEPDHIEVLR